MTQIIVGLLLIWLGYRVYRRSQNQRRFERQLAERTQHTRDQELWAMKQRLEELRLQKASVELSIEQMRRENRLAAQRDKLCATASIGSTKPTLDEQIVLDAMAEMNRAKAAVVAVLRTVGASQSRIDEVMDQIERPERHEVD